MPSYDAKFSKTLGPRTMLIPDNIHPEQTIYFNASFLLGLLRDRHDEDLLDLYVKTVATHKMTFPVFLLCLDWLFLIDLITVDEHQKVKLCS